CWRRAVGLRHADVLLSSALGDTAPCMTSRKGGWLPSPTVLLRNGQDTPLKDAAGEALSELHLQPQRVALDRLERGLVEAVLLDAVSAGALDGDPAAVPAVDDAPRCRNATLPATRVVEPVDLDARYLPRSEERRVGKEGG